jgi:hypothetical protein
MVLMHEVFYTLFALVLLTAFGNAVCRGLFTAAGLKDKDIAPDVQPAGWIIGWLERTVIAVGIVTQSWELLAAVIALKTVARFQKLDTQKFAEEFLVGSLFSVLWAVLITSAWLVYDRQFGSDLRMKITNALEVTDQSTGACATAFIVPRSMNWGGLCNGEVGCATTALLCVAQEIKVEADDGQVATD